MKKTLFALFHNYHLFISLIFFAILEIRLPYFFIQDDNYSQFYPIISKGLDFIYLSGELPLYSFIHGNGVPIFESFQYGFIDPVLHISYWASKILDLPYALFDFYCFIYFILITSLFLKINRQNKLISIILFFTFLFSGHILMTLRSWYYLCPYLLNLSIILWRAQKMANSKFYSFKFFPESIWIGFSIFLGNPQFYFYSICIYLSAFIFFGLIQKVSIKDIFTSLVINSIPIFICASIAISLFLNNPQISARNYFIFEGLNIYTLIQMFIPPLKVILKGYYEAPSYHWEYYYLSPVVLAGIYLIFFKHIPLLFKKSKIDKEWHFDLFLSTIAIISFAFISPLFLIFKFLPLLAKFHKAFKLFYIFLFSTSILGIRFLQKKSSLNSYLIVGSFLYLTYMLLFLDKGFYEYKIAKGDPYQLNNISDLPLKKSYAKVYSVAPLRSHDQNFANSMSLNFGLMNNIITINGYEPMAQSKNRILNQEDLHFLGVTHLLLFKENPQLDNPWAVEYEKEYAYYIKYPPRNSSLVFSNKNINLFHIENKSLIKKVNYGINKIEFILNRPINLNKFPIKLTYNRKITGDVHGKSFRIKAENGLMVIDEPIVSDRFTLKYSIWEGGLIGKIKNKVPH